MLPVHIKLGLCNKAEYHPRWSVLCTSSLRGPLATLVRFLVIIVTPASKTAPKTAPRQPFQLHFSSSTSALIQRAAQSVCSPKDKPGDIEKPTLWACGQVSLTVQISPQTWQMGVSASRLFHINDKVPRRYAVFWYYQCEFGRAWKPSRVLSFLPYNSPQVDASKYERLRLASSLNSSSSSSSPGLSLRPDPIRSACKTRCFDIPGQDKHEKICQYKG